MFVADDVHIPDLGLRIVVISRSALMADKASTSLRVVVNALLNNCYPEAFTVPADNSFSTHVSRAGLRPPASPGFHVVSHYKGRGTSWRAAGTGFQA